MAPNDAGSISTSEALVKSLKVLGCPDNGAPPCRDSMDADEWAYLEYISASIRLLRTTRRTEKAGELE